MAYIELVPRIPNISGMNEILFQLHQYALHSEV
jgi:hypothetical protein